LFHALNSHHCDTAKLYDNRVFLISDLLWLRFHMTFGYQPPTAVECRLDARDIAARSSPAEAGVHAHAPPRTHRWREPRPPGVVVVSSIYSISLGGFPPTEFHFLCELPTSITKPMPPHGRGKAADAASAK